MWLNSGVDVLVRDEKQATHYETPEEAAEALGKHLLPVGNRHHVVMLFALEVESGWRDVIGAEWDHLLRD